MTVHFVLNGRSVDAESSGSLLSALRDEFGIRSAKDGCAPQGQCGCCTVWVDGDARVACVTPLPRVEGRTVTTLEGLDSEARGRMTEALCATGGSQCGFCTPGIVMRVAAERRADATADDLKQALLAHLCRCTGWQTIVEAFVGDGEPESPVDRDLDAAGRRATIEGRSPQIVSPGVAAGEGGFADDTHPSDAEVGVLDGRGEWVFGPTSESARSAAKVVPGRRSTVGLTWPVEVPVDSPVASDFVRTLTTGWVEPAYLEPDAVWCKPGGEPRGPLVNGGAFGAKTSSWLADQARRLAAERGRTVRLVLSREDVVRLGAKRPPMAAGIRADGTGHLWLRRTDGAPEALAAFAPNWRCTEVDAAGPPTSVDARAALWAEIAVLRASIVEPGEFGDLIEAPNGARAWARVDDERVRVRVACGRALDTAVLRSYCIGAAHMALGWVRSEGIAVGIDGNVHDLTIRSFGVLRAIDMPVVEVEIVDDDSEPVNGSDAVFAAVAAAAWRHEEFAPRWPTRRAR